MADELIPERKDIASADRWNLQPLFASDDAWYAAFSLLEGRLDGYRTFRGTLSRSAADLKKAIEYDLELSREIEKLYTYAHLRHDEDLAANPAAAMFQKIANFGTRAAEASSYMVPEIQAIEPQVVKSFLADTQLAPYKVYLEKILRHREHTRSEEVEELLAMAGEVCDAAEDIFRQLDNSDMSFGVIEDDKGRKVELSHGNFGSLLQSRSRDVRKKAFEQYYAEYDAHRNALAASLASSVKTDWFRARARRFSSCRKKSLFHDNVPVAVYDSLIEAVRGSLEPMGRYLNLRRRVLGVEELHMYDTYVPLVASVDFCMSYEEAVDTCCAALAPLGEEYVNIMRQGLSEGWVDRYENRGKRSGAYSSGCYDSAPYILTNYRSDNINSLYTLIHEAGHSMHTLFSNRTQPFVYHRYEIFVAEVASTFNEILLSAHLLDKYKDDPAMKAYIVNREIDDIRGTLFRQTMFAEYEKNVHLLAESNQPLTLEVLRAEYRTLLQTYFAGEMVIDDVLELEALRIPHFYFAFYVYKYATGISAAISLADRVLKGESGAVERYLHFLGMGGSQFPLDELRQAGVDLEKPEPVREALMYFDSMVRTLEELL